MKTTTILARNSKALMVSLNLAAGLVILPTYGLAAVKVAGNSASNQQLVLAREESRATSGSALAPPVSLTPAMKDILKLVKAQVSPEIIKAYINNHPYAYRMSADQIIAFKEGGVSADIIEAMLLHKDRAPPQPVRIAQPKAQAQPQPQTAPAYNTTPPAYNNSTYNQSAAGSASTVYVIPYNYPTTYRYWWYNYGYSSPWWGASYAYWPVYSYYPYYGYGHRYHPYYGAWHHGSKYSHSYGRHPNYTGGFPEHRRGFPDHWSQNNIHRGTGSRPVYAANRTFSPRFQSRNFAAPARSISRPTMSSGFRGAARPAMMGGFSGGQRFGGMRSAAFAGGGGGFRGGRR